MAQACADSPAAYPVASAAYLYKVKAERINALRKQYDAFLEDDKKRKDRNEYILERLDRMRSCSTVVQIRKTPKVYGFSDFNLSFNDNEGMIERNLPVLKKTDHSCNDRQTKNILTTLNTPLLDEISKNYILIPRHANVLGYDSNFPISSTIDDNADWKSKYSILNELKKNENEEQTNLLVKNQGGNSRNLKYDDNKIEHNNNTKKIDLHHVEDTFQMFPDDSEVLPDKLHTKFTTLPENTKTQEGEKEPNEKLCDLSSNNDTHAHITELGNQLTNTINLASDISPLREDFKIKEQHEANDTKNNHELTEKEKIQADYEMKLKPQEQQQNMTPIQRVTDDIKYPNVNTDNNTPMEILAKSEHIQQETLKNEVFSEDHSTGFEYQNILKESLPEINLEPGEINESSLQNSINVYPQYKEDLQEKSTINQEVYDSSQDNKNQYISQPSSETEFINPVEPIQHYDQVNYDQESENVFNENQIQEFESEQNNMFYSEQVEANYGYDQMGAGETVKEEYPNNEDYVQNENYVYYEGAPQEQAYSSEINEHVESTEQYDPHYEEQYGNYEQVNQQNMPIDQNDNEANVNQQSYDETQFEKPGNNVLQEVERQLDSEEGYDEPIKIKEENIDNVVEQTITPEPQAAVEEEATVT
ncbi:involucrin-like [Battus philenor]|uniref:involucrin-like n=1 Tax=Battus philenor TaxID=42288 RepID=UPI0035D0E1E5